MKNLLTLEELAKRPGFELIRDMLTIIKDKKTIQEAHKEFMKKVDEELNKGIK